MKQHYKAPDIWYPLYGETYFCDGPFYNCCTVYRYDKMGIAVVQQRYDEKKKVFYWGSLDPWIANDIYLSKNFSKFYGKHCGYKDKKGCYPVFKVRSVMWELRMKPLKKEKWEEI